METIKVKDVVRDRRPTSPLPLETREGVVHLLLVRGVEVLRVEVDEGLDGRTQGVNMLEVGVHFVHGGEVYGDRLELCVVEQFFGRAVDVVYVICGVYVGCELVELGEDG